MHKLFLPLLLIAGSLLGITPTHAQNPDRPNILIMMVDDLGFADFGCYGSEIETPNIDRLAGEGLRFSQFYNTAKCHSSRVSLLSGLYCNQAGSEELNRATTIAQVLKDAGYATSMTGKWHLSKEPTDFGFEQYWGHLSGATDFFVGDNTFRLNGQPWSEFKDGFYTTDANIDFSMQFLDRSLESGKPFFHYIAFNAPHYPLQAPEADIRKYAGRYDAGWSTIRDQRFAKQKSLGIFPSDMVLPPMPSHVPSWDDLGSAERTFESFRMSIFAAMVDRIDQNIGRLVEYLKDKGQLDNTLIMLCSDNGACPFERSKKMDIAPWKPKSYYTYDASWATVGNTPLRHYKQTQHEGGISSPLIVRWPGHVKNAGGWERSVGHLVDFMATCIEVAGASYPDTEGLEPLQGKSLVPLFRGETREGHEDLYFQFSSCRALRQGDWKAVSFYGSAWELYNIAEDRCEQHDLASKVPERVAAMAERWQDMAVRLDHLPPKQSGPVKTTTATHQQKTWHTTATADGWTKPAWESK